MKVKKARKQKIAAAIGAAILFAAGASRLSRQGVDFKTEQAAVAIQTAAALQTFAVVSTGGPVMKGSGETGRGDAAKPGR